MDLPAPFSPSREWISPCSTGEVGAVNRADEGILLDNPAHFNCVQTSSPPGRLSAAGAGVSRLLRGLVLVGGHPASSSSAVSQGTSSPAVILALMSSTAAAMSSGRTTLESVLSKLRSPRQCR